MRYLEWVCTAKMDKELFRTTYTLTLNDHGGIENDFTVTRLAEDEFLVVTGASATNYVLNILRTSKLEYFKDRSPIGGAHDLSIRHLINIFSIIIKYVFTKLKILVLETLLIFKRLSIFL